MAAATRKYPVQQSRPFDYLYDSTYLVSGARDYARTCFRSAMGSAQVVLQPVYKDMFSELRRVPRIKAVCHPNCRLPPHLDRSYPAYVRRTNETRQLPAPAPVGRNLYMFVAVPQRVSLTVTPTTPDFRPPAPPPQTPPPAKPRNRATQSQYRESSAQTIPWQPDGHYDPDGKRPEVTYLDKLQWGPGDPYRIGDLPADFHTTEIINKMRHARAWLEVAERGGRMPRWMAQRDQIMYDVETKDWIFREAEIDELQDIRLSLLHKMQSADRNKATSRTSVKLARRWEANKQRMAAKVDNIRKARDREIRKLTALHTSGGRAGLVQRMRASRAMGSSAAAACDPTSDVHAAVARHGYQARGRHADITYDPTLLQLEDHNAIAKMPDWLLECGENLKKSCSGHQLPRDPRQLCERETKWSESFLENLHADLRKARMGAAAEALQAAPLAVLKARRLCATPRPATPAAPPVPEREEAEYQAALLLQRILRGRAVQCLMYEGRTRAAELTEELKTTHGLQKEDRARIAREETRAREYNAQRTEAEQKEDAVQGLVDELVGGAASAALDFLEKELRRLKEERRQHAYILMALREKQMREAAEAGRRQKEEHRRREHDEMFKQILGVTQETVEAYLEAIIEQGTELGSEAEAVRRAERQADRIDASAAEYGSMSTAEQNECVAELVHQLLLPEAHKMAAKRRIASMQAAKMEAARKAIFGLLDEAEQKTPMCSVCGAHCRCPVCPGGMRPTATAARDDPHWTATVARPRSPQRTEEERCPLPHAMRLLLDTLVDGVVVKSRADRAEREAVGREVCEALRTKVEVALDARSYATDMVKLATGEKQLPVRTTDYHHFSLRIREDALERTEPVEIPVTCPKQLPSEIRRLAEEKAAAEALCNCPKETPRQELASKLDPCTCERHPVTPSVSVATGLDYNEPEQRKLMLPSQIRMYEAAKRCKCDVRDSLENTDEETVADSTDVDTDTWSPRSP